MKAILLRLKREFIAVIPPTVFFFCAFQVISLTRALMLAEYGIDRYSFINTSIAALIVAKVILVADLLPLVNRFPEKPLIYNVVWKTTIYVLAAFVVRYIEHLIPYIDTERSIVSAHEHLIDSIVWPYFWAVHIWLLVLLLVFCAARELVRSLGPRRVFAMFFRHPAGLSD